MLLTEKVRGDIGGKSFRVFEVTAVSGGVGYALSTGALNMNYVLYGTYTPTVCVLSAGSTTIPVLKVAESSVGGTDITLSAHAVSGESGVLTVWGY